MNLYLLVWEKGPGCHESNQITLFNQDLFVVFKYRFVHFLHVTLPPSNFGRKSLYVSQLLYNGCGYPPVIAYHSLREIKTLSVFMALNRLYTLEIKSQKFSFLNVSFGKYALELNKNGCVNGMKAR